MKKLTLFSALFLISNNSILLAGNFSTGIGFGLSYSVASPFIGYDFKNRIDADISLNYFKPYVDVLDLKFFKPYFDFTADFKYGFKSNDENRAIGPILTFGQRHFKSNQYDFESPFIGFGCFYKSLITHSNSIELQVGVESFTNGNIGLIPYSGFSYGYDFCKQSESTTKPEIVLSNPHNALLTTGQIIGGILAVSGATFAGFMGTSLGYPLFYGIPDFFFLLGSGTFALGSVDFLICTKIKSMRQK